MESNDGQNDPPQWCLGSRGDTLLNAMMQDSERGQVLIGAEFLENLLEESLHARFSRENVDNKLRKRLLSQDPWCVLGSFGAMLVASRGFGVIGDEEYKALDAVRRIRNAFAHSDFAVTMDDPDPKVSEPVAILAQYVQDKDQHSECVDKAGNRTTWWRLTLATYGICPDNPPSKHHVFLGALIWLCIALAVARQREMGGADGTQLAI